MAFAPSFIGATLGLFALISYWMLMTGRCSERCSGQDADGDDYVVDQSCHY